MIYVYRIYMMHDKYVYLDGNKNFIHDKLFIQIYISKYISIKLKKSEFWRYMYENKEYEV